MLIQTVQEKREKLARRQMEVESIIVQARNVEFVGDRLVGTIPALLVRMIPTTRLNLFIFNSITPFTM